MSRDPADYRPCAGVMLVNAEGKVFVGQRIDSRLDAWQMPQGGVDDGEDASAAALRELGEETGIASEHAEFVAQAPGEYYYEIPAEMVGKVWKKRWLGQRMRWFLFRFTGADSDVNIATAHPEFRQWRWAEVDELEHIIVPFKRDLYRDVVAAFREHL